MSKPISGKIKKNVNLSSAELTLSVVKINVTFIFYSSDVNAIKCLCIGLNIFISKMFTYTTHTTIQR